MQQLVLTTDQAPINELLRQTIKDGHNWHRQTLETWRLYPQPWVTSSHMKSCRRKPTYAHGQVLPYSLSLCILPWNSPSYQYGIDKHASCHDSAGWFCPYLHCLVNGQVGSVHSGQQMSVQVQVLAIDDQSCICVNLSSLWDITHCKLNLYGPNADINCSHTLLWSIPTGKNCSLDNCAKQCEILKLEPDWSLNGHISACRWQLPNYHQSTDSCAYFH